MEKNHKNLQEFIVIDLETIGLEKESGRIIEIAALHVRDWKISRAYSQLIDPEMKIPRVITNLTGIRNADVQGQPTFKQCAGDFLEFIGALPLVGHNLFSFDKPYLEYNLQKCGFKNRLDNPALDTLELAIFLLPELRKHKLEYLYQQLVSKNIKQKHRAQDDCEMTLAVLKKLKLVRDREWDGNWLAHAGAIAKKEAWAWADFILDFEKKLDLGPAVHSFLPIENYLEDLNWEKMKKIKAAAEAENKQAERGTANGKKEYARVSSAEIKKIFAPGAGAGSLHAVLGKRYEYREPQSAMAARVSESINNDMHLVVEAPTGCGKSLAYLAPALLWSLKNANSPVIISTYTNALQDQLFESDFKLAAQIFGPQIKITVAKGREHYVCIRKLKKYLAEAFEDKRALRLAPERFSKILFAVFLANWVIRNKDNNCDLDRFSFWLDNKSKGFSKARINSTRDSCQHQFCEYYPKCFVNKLKLASREANVVVTNHSLVFSDLWSNPSIFSILPNGFKVLIIDEAINLEDAATSASTETFSRNEFAYLLKDFFGQARAHKGFLRRMENYASRTAADNFGKDAERMRALAGRLAWENQALFDCVMKQAGARPLEYDDRAEIFPALISEADAILQNIALGLNELNVFLDKFQSLHCAQKKDNFGKEVKNFQKRFAGYGHFLALLCELDKNEHIFYRVINADKSDCSLNYCCKNVGKYLDENLYGKDLKSIIFTSATLTYEKSFDFVKKIWGLAAIPQKRLAYLCLPHLFDYEKQAALLIVNHLPNREQGKAAEEQKHYYSLTADFLKNLLIANNGSALLLFTNKKDAAKFGELLACALEENNIPLYSTEPSQDLRIMSGNKSSIVEEFRESIESCLIGTAGLREGINIPGESLELAALVRLPFQVPTDPINYNRQAVYGGFNGYTLPHCVFNIKQAFGRLIRAKTDSGFFFIVDERAMNYLAAIKNNLPEKLKISNLLAADFARFNKLLANSKGAKERVNKILKK